MYHPPHPGEILSNTVLRKRYGLSVTAFAKHLKVSRVALARVVNGLAAVDADLAIRLADALGGTPESWLKMQNAYDLAQARRQRRLRIVPLEPEPNELMYGKTS